MRLELVVDGRDLALDAAPLAPLSELLRTEGFTAGAGELVLLDEELVRADDVPALQAHGAAIRTARSFAEARFTAKVTKLAGALDAQARDRLVVAASALVQPDAVSDGDDLAALLAPFAAGVDSAELTALVRREATRTARSLEAPPSPVRKPRERSRTRTRPAAHRTSRRAR